MHFFEMHIFYTTNLSYFCNIKLTSIVVNTFVTVTRRNIEKNNDSCRGTRKAKVIWYL